MSINSIENEFAVRPLISSFEEIVRLTSSGHNVYLDRVRYTFNFPVALFTGAILAEFLVMLYPLAHWCAPFHGLGLNDTISNNSNQTSESLEGVNKSSVTPNCELHLPTSVLSHDHLNVLVCPAGFEWDPSPMFTGSLVRQMGWVCKRAFLHSLAIYIAVFGFIYGGVLAGFIAESCGRMKTFVSACFLNMILRFLLISFVHISEELLLLTLFWYSSTLPSIIMLPTIITAENFNDEERACLFPISAILYPLGFSVALYIFNGSSLWYFVVVGVFTCILLLPLMAYWNMIYEESLRWLFMKKKFESCARLLRHIALANDITSFSKVFYKMCLRRLWEYKKPYSGQLTPNFQSPVTPCESYLRTLLIVAPWIINPSIAVVTIISVPEFHDLQYAAAATLYAVTLAIVAVAPIIMSLAKIVGRRCAQIALYTLCLILYILLFRYQDTKSLEWVLVILTLICLVLSSSVSFMMSVEMMPTQSRTIHIGCFMSISCLSGCATCLLVEIIARDWWVQWQPFIFCAVMCLIALAAISCTIETKNADLPDAYTDLVVLLHNHLVAEHGLY